MTWLKGKRRSLETRQKISVGLKKWYDSHLHPLLGRTVSITKRNQQSESMKKFYELHPEARTKRLLTEFKKGQKSWNKGKEMSEESRKKMSEAHKKLTGSLNSFFGKHHTSETKEKLANYHKKLVGNLSPLFGKHLSQETKEKISKRHLGKSSPYMSGDLNPAKRPEVREKIRTFHLRPEIKEKYRMSRLKQIFPSQDTSIECKLQKQLDEMGVLYEKHKPILGQPDIYIPSMKLAIFADGNYWHSRIHKPKVYQRDFANKRQLELEGHNIIRLDEKDILKSNFDIKKAIERAKPLMQETYA